MRTAGKSTTGQWSLKILGLALLLWIGLFLFADGRQVQAVVDFESRGCSQACQAAIEAPMRDTDRAFDEWTAGIRSELAGAAPVSGSVRHFDAALRNGLWRFSVERLYAARALVRLCILRIEMLAASLGLLVLFIVAVAVDAAVMRRIAHETFETSRPAVSLTSGMGFLAALACGSALSVMPFAGAGLLGLTVMAAGCVGLHAWVRYFHRL